MNVRFWGVRGSLPVPGPGPSATAATPRASRSDRRRAPASSSTPAPASDAGQGADAPTREAGRADAHLLISHTHWDHIQGLPFFAPLYQQGNQLHVYARKRDDLHLRAVFASQTDDPYFPVPFDETEAEVDFRELTDSAEFEIADVKVACARLNHPYIATAYRLSTDGAKVVYVSDTAPFADILFEDEFVGAPAVARQPSCPPQDRQKLARMRQGVVRLCEGADLVIYDTMFTARGLPADAALRALAPDGRDRDLPRGRGAAPGAVPPRARAHRRRGRRHAGRHPRAGRSRGTTLDVMAAYEGLDVNLSRSPERG